MRKRAVVIAVIAAVAAAGVAGMAWANADDNQQDHPTDSVTKTSNNEPGSGSDYWTDERKRNATGG